MEYKGYYGRGLQERHGAKVWQENEAPVNPDATEHGQLSQLKDNPRQSALSGQEREIRKVKKLCFNCGKPGHRERSCRSPTQRLQPVAENEAGMEATKAEPLVVVLLSVTNTTQGSNNQYREAPMSDFNREDEIRETNSKHALLSWTVCFEDRCPIHRSSKEGSGWYPQAGRKDLGNYVQWRDERNTQRQQPAATTTTDIMNDPQNQSQERQLIIEEKENPTISCWELMKNQETHSDWVEEMMLDEDQGYGSMEWES